MPGWLRFLAKSERPDSCSAPEVIKGLPAAAEPKQGELTDAQLKALRRNVHFAELERKMGGKTRVAK